MRPERSVFHRRLVESSLRLLTQIAPELHVVSDHRYISDRFVRSYRRVSFKVAAARALQKSPVEKRCASGLIADAIEILIRYYFDDARFNSRHAAGKSGLG